MIYKITHEIGADKILSSPLNLERVSIPIKQNEIATRSISIWRKRGFVFDPNIPKTIAMTIGATIAARKECNKGSALTVLMSSSVSSSYMICARKDSNSYYFND